MIGLIGQPEFYVRFDWLGLHYLAFIAAPEQPEVSYF